MTVHITAKKNQQIPNDNKSIGVKQGVKKKHSWLPSWTLGKVVKMDSVTVDRLPFSVSPEELSAEENTLHSW